jgi:hypothetical protein
MFDELNQIENLEPDPLLFQNFTKAIREFSETNNCTNKQDDIVSKVSTTNKIKKLFGKRKRKMRILRENHNELTLFEINELNKKIRKEMKKINKINSHRFYGGFGDAIHNNDTHSAFKWIEKLSEKETRDKMNNVPYRKH